MGVYYSYCFIPKDNTVRPAPDRLVALIAAWAAKGFIVGPENLPAREIAGRDLPMAETGACFRTEPPLPAPVKEEPQPEPPRTFWSRLFGAPQRRIRPPDSKRRQFAIPPVGDSLAALSQPLALIEWSSNPNATYPMQTLTQFTAELRLVIQISDDFVNPHTDGYGVGGDAKQIEPACGCGCDLSYEGPTCWLDTARIRRICPACGRSFRPQDQLAEIVDGATAEKSLQPGGLCHRFAIIVDFGKDSPTYVRDARGELVNAKARASDLFLSTCSGALGLELNGFDHYG
jgi:hypothetical protein